MSFRARRHSQRTPRARPMLAGEGYEVPRGDNEICLSCLFWNADASLRAEAERVHSTRIGIAPKLECRSRPPQVLPSAQTMWPTTLPSDWCGEWEKLEEE
jgi:hypothetical protein